MLREEVHAAWEEAGKKTLFVLIDEVQKAPALLDVVHALFNENPKTRAILIDGSSAASLNGEEPTFWPAGPTWPICTP